MKHYFLFFLLVVSNGLAQSKDCSNFKTGTFKYSDTELKDWTIIRTDTLQIEKNNATGRVLTGKIEWVSDCHYNLIFIDVNSQNKSIIGKKIEVTILSTSKDSYESYGKSGKESAKSTLIKMN